MQRRYACFDLYEMEMWGDGEGGWEENNRFSLGRLLVPCNENGDFTERDILKAMKHKKVRSIVGSPYMALRTIDKRVVWIEETSDLTYEIGAVKFHKPVYLLQYVGSCIK